MYDSNATFSVFIVPRFRVSSEGTDHTIDPPNSGKDPQESYKMLIEDNYPQFEHSENIFS